MILGTVLAMLSGIVMMYVCSTITAENVDKAVKKQNDAIRA